MSRGLAALFGVGLATAWIFGLIYDVPRWLVWSDAGLAFVALGGLASAGSPGLEGAATWPFVALGLLAVWMFGLATHTTAWATWLNFGFGCGFAGITVTLMLPRIDPAHLARRHGH
jgi:hypothetical protein